MSDLFTSSDDLRQVFQLDAHPEYVEFTPFKTGLGFSVQQPYPPNCRYSPPMKKDGTPDTYALIRVSYRPNQRSSAKPNLVPISADVSVFCRYLYTHLDYDFSDSDCPTEESVTASKKTPKPIDLSVFDQYFYDHERDGFLDAAGKKIEGIDIINRLYNDHVDTIGTFKGFMFRWKLTSKNKIVSLCEVIRGILKWLLGWLCGRTLKPDNIFGGMWGDYRPEDMKLLKTESIDVFGYKASKNVIVTFCAFLLIGYSLFHFAEKKCIWLSGIVSNSLLSFGFSILCISFLDHALPKILLYMINALGHLQFKILTKSVRFRQP